MPRARTDALSAPSKESKRVAMRGQAGDYQKPKGHPLSGARETCLAPNVLPAPVLPPHASRPPPHASRPPPHAPRRRGQRVQAGLRPFPAGYCLTTPTAELGKVERGAISTSGPTISVWHQTGRFFQKILGIFPTRRSIVDGSLVAGVATRQRLQACLQDSYR